MCAHPLQYGVKMYTRLITFKLCRASCPVQRKWYISISIQSGKQHVSSLRNVQEISGAEAQLPIGGQGVNTD